MVEFKYGDIYIEVSEGGPTIKQWMRKQEGWHYIDETGRPEVKSIMRDTGVSAAFRYMSKHYPGNACVMRGEEVLTTDGIQTW